MIENFNKLIPKMENKSHISKKDFENRFKNTKFNHKNQTEGIKMITSSDRSAVEALEKEILAENGLYQSFLSSEAELEGYRDK